LILTVCIVTKGREEFLTQLLESLDALMEHPNVEVLIVNNGTGPKIAGVLNSWRNSKKCGAEIINAKNNSQALSIYWSEIQSKSSPWIIFPGDDDILSPTIVDSWLQAIEENPDLVGYAFSASKVTHSNHNVGQVMHPATLQIDSPGVRLAQAMHEPPFIWPALIFRQDVMPGVIPRARYVLDWYISLLLLMKGQVKTDRQKGLRYRVHEGQESAVVSNQRKYFEGAYWMSALIDSQDFSNWLIHLTESEVLMFWSEVLKKPPIYDDLMSGSKVLFLLARKILEISSSPILEDTILNGLALKNGVILKRGDTGSFLSSPIHEKSLSESNILVNVSSSSCQKFILATLNFSKGNETENDLFIKCQHAQRSTRGYLINCSKLVFDDETNGDLVGMEMSKIFEKSNRFIPALSPSEKLALNVLAKLRPRIPSFVKYKIKKFTNPRDFA
jgi:hypothetical protein